MRHILTILALLMLYRFIVRIIVPLVRVTRNTANGLKDMEGRMNNMEQKSGRKPRNGDYIDYEEVK